MTRAAARNSHALPVTSSFRLSWASSEVCPLIGRPAIFFYENTPGGIGLSQTISENYREINKAVIDLIRNCPCTDGGPGCVGAAGENGVGGKAEALAICQSIGEDPHE